MSARPTARPADTVYVTDTAIISGTGTFAPISYASTGGTFSRGVILVTGSGNNYIRVYSTAAGRRLRPVHRQWQRHHRRHLADEHAGHHGRLHRRGGRLGQQHAVCQRGRQQRSPDTMSLSATGVRARRPGSRSATRRRAATLGGGVYLVTGSAANTVHVYGTAAGSSNGIELGNGNNTVISFADVHAGHHGRPDCRAGRDGRQPAVHQRGRQHLAGQALCQWRPVQSSTTGFFVSYAAAPGGTFGRGVDVVGGSGNNQIYVVGQLAGSPIGVFGGAGNDLIDVYVTAITFYNLWLDGQGGTNFLYVYDLTGGGMTNAVTGPDLRRGPDHLRRRAAQHHSIQQFELLREICKRCGEDVKIAGWNVAPDKVDFAGRAAVNHHVFAGAGHGTGENEGLTCRRIGRSR